MSTVVNTIDMRYAFFSGIFLSSLLSCHQPAEVKNKSMEEVAGNEDVLQYMKSFDGRGDLSDTAKTVAPGDALRLFTVSPDLAIDLVLAEPHVTQPVFMCFDSRGRLWVVQYDQYPYPEGLKVTSMDQHIRAQFDKMPQPPPAGVKGADKISVFEDEDGDGRFEKGKDVITGLNIVTSVAFGRGNIWVLNPPYLLAYPDADDDGTPDGPPVVHLKGFGIEDTHAVANNLRWGPDGWLYGAQGSTCTADVSSAVTKHVRFNGQAIWRYNTDTKVFEVFAEGGGNTFDIEIDEKGRLYSGDNGVSHGQYYKQGAYYPRNLGKHGALTNRYAFGRLENMALKGEEIRFTHAFVRYEGAALPERFNEHMIAINPLQGFVQLCRFEPNGSTFATVDEERIVQTADRSFRPVDICSGPDGAVYIADWYDSRLSHVDPRDTWSKSTGRIYRLRSKTSKAGVKPFDIGKSTDAALVQLLSHKNNWYRQQALHEIGNRHSDALLAMLLPLLQSNDAQLSLEALWAINQCGGFDEKTAAIALRHRDPFVRMWAVRFLGDRTTVAVNNVKILETLAASEKHPEVQSQIAATAKRLPGAVGLRVIRNLLPNIDPKDPDIPMQIWWAFESKAVSNRDELLSLFADRTIWQNPVVVNTVLSRLMQRYAITGESGDLATCAQLLNLAPAPEYAGILINGLQEGLRGRETSELPGVLLSALHPYRKLFSDESLALHLRRGDAEAVEKALAIIANSNAPLVQRLSYIKILGEINQPKAVPVLLSAVESGRSSPAIRQAGLLALQRYGDEEIGRRVVKAYPDLLRSDPDVRAAALSLLATRPAWAMDLLNAIAREKKPGEDFIGRTIDKADVPEHIVRQLKLLNDNSLTAMSNRIWPDLHPATSPEKNNTIEKITTLVKSGKGNAGAGRVIFTTRCGSCHRLFGEGGNIGPDLTGYDRTNLPDLLTNIIDPSAFIREGYTLFNITTTDGRFLVGRLISREGTAITLQPFTGDAITLSESQVKAMEAQKSSLMPERLLDGLSDQEVRDLIAYIMQAKT